MDELRRVMPKVDPSRRARVWSAVETGLDARRSTATLWMALGAAAAMGIAAFAWMARGPEIWSAGPFSAEHAPREAQLPDGSRIALASGSTIDRCEADGTCIALDHGAVTLSVRPQHAPLRVRAHDIEVRVVGTRFTVEARDGEVDVRVEEGRVEVARAGTVLRVLGPTERWSSTTEPPPSPPPSPSPVVGNDEAPSPPPAAPDPVRAPREAQRRPPPPDKALSADALWTRAIQAKVEDDVRLEETSYKQLVARFPQDPRTGRACFELARLSMDVQRSPGDAVRWLLQAIERGPNASYAEDAWARLAKAAAASGDRERCVSARTTYLGRYPRGVHAASVREACP